MTARACLACGASLEGTRQKKYCANNGKCKMRYHRGARAEPAESKKSSDGIESTEAATMLTLADAGRLGTPLGQAALVLARRIDRSHADTGAGVASLVKQLQQTLDAATAGVTKEKSELDRARDELAERRERRGA